MTDQRQVKFWVTVWFGCRVLWWATVIGWAVQSLASRLGTVTGRHLAQLCRMEYNKGTALIIWIFTELAIIGSDIQEVMRRFMKSLSLVLLC